MTNSVEIADVEEKSEENQNEERVDEQKEEQNEERSEEQASDVVVNYEFIGNNMVSSQNDLNQHNISNDDRILDMLLWRQVGEMQLRHRLTNILVLIMTIQIIAINIFLFWLGLGKITLNNLEPLR